MLAVLCAGSFAVLMDMTIVNVALPSIQAGLASIGATLKPSTCSARGTS
jgi:hypothetical protein